MRWAAAALVFGLIVSGCAWGPDERELLLVTQGIPVAATVSESQTCVEVGEDGGGGSWCSPSDQEGAVWLGAASPEGEAIVVGQAPSDVVSIVLAGDDRVQELLVEDSGVGRFFVGLGVPTGDYEVRALLADGDLYLSGEMDITPGGTTGVTITP